MRVGIGNILTTERHLELAWKRVIQEAERLGDSAGVGPS